MALTVYWLPIQLVKSPFSFLAPDKGIIPQGHVWLKERGGPGSLNVWFFSSQIHGEILKVWALSVLTFPVKLLSQHQDLSKLIDTVRVCSECLLEQV